MRASLLGFLLAVLPTVASAQPAPTARPDTPLPAPMSAEECAVWARELSFADSVARHDAAAFAAHLHPQAAFGASGPRPTRGRDAIAREWSGLIAGRPVVLAWYPSRVTIAGEGDIAYSTGPALFERLDSKAGERFTLSRFFSVWHRGEDGAWRVLFDDGIAPRPASEEEVAAFREGRRDTCPAG